MIPEGKYIDVQDDFRFHYYDEGEGDVAEEVAEVDKARAKLE